MWPPVHAANHNIVIKPFTLYDDWGMQNVAPSPFDIARATAHGHSNIWLHDDPLRPNNCYTGNVHERSAPMCKRRYDHGKRHTAISATMHAYEGNTVRLNDQSAEPAQTRVRRHCGGFPWWTLWLIWPALGALRFSITHVAAAVAAIANPLLIIQVIGAIALIAAGVALLWIEKRKG
jgi:hypothetical protein